MVLNFQRSLPKTDFSQLHMCLFAPVKTGKTTFMAQAKKGDKEPLFVATEDGHHALGVFSVPVTNWQGFLSLVDHLETNQEELLEKHSCLVFDLIADLEEMCETYILEADKTRPASLMECQGGWIKLKKEFSTAIYKLMRFIPCHFICHSKDREVLYNGETVKSQVPALPPCIMTIINAKVDLIGYIIPQNHTKSKPYITFENSIMATCGSRYSHMQRAFVLDHTNMKASYDAINEHFKSGGKTNGK